MSFKPFAIIIILLIAASCKKNVQDKQEEIEFDYIKNQIVLSVFIGDQGPYNMLLDTGVVPSVIDLETAKSLNLPIDTLQSGNAVGRGNDKIKLFPAVIEQLSLNHKNYGNIDAVTLNLTYLGKPLGTTLHGILGYSFLNDKIIRINYGAKTIQIFESKAQLNAVISDKVHISKFIFDDNDIIPILDNLMLNNKKFIGSIDTGSSLNIEVYDHHIKNFGIMPDTTNTYQITGAQGKESVTKSVAGSFKMGNSSFKDQEITVSAVKNKNQLRMGNIGNKFLENFIVSFDYKTQEVLLEAY